MVQKRYVLLLREGYGAADLRGEMSDNKDSQRGQGACTDCGAGIRPGSAFCVSCGVQIGSGGPRGEDFERYLRERVEAKKRAIEGLQVNLASRMPAEAVLRDFEGGCERLSGRTTAQEQTAVRELKRRRPELVKDHYRLVGQLGLLDTPVREYSSGKKTAAEALTAIASLLGAEEGVLATRELEAVEERERPFQEYVARARQLTEGLERALAADAPWEEALRSFEEGSERLRITTQVPASEEGAWLRQRNPGLYEEYGSWSKKLSSLEGDARAHREGKKTIAQVLCSMASTAEITVAARILAGRRRELQEEGFGPEFVLETFQKYRGASERVKRNIASDAPLDEVLHFFVEDCDGCTINAAMAYSAEPYVYQEVEEEGLAPIWVPFLMAQSSAKAYFEGKKTSAEAVAGIAEWLEIPVPKRANAVLAAEEAHRELEEKDRELRTREREIEWLWDEVRRLRDALGGLELDRSLARQEEGRRLLAEEQAKLQKRKRDEKVAGMFTAAIQTNILRHYMNDVNDSKKSGADLEEIRKRRQNPLRHLDFFDR